MAKGTRYTPEFKAKAVRLLAESRSSYSSETNAISAVCLFLVKSVFRVSSLIFFGLGLVPFCWTRR